MTSNDRVDDYVTAFGDFDAYTVADAIQRVGVGGVLDTIRPQTTNTTFVGRALTARIDFRPFAALSIKDYGGAALYDAAGPGDAVLLDAGAVPLTAVGDLAVDMARLRGAAAVLVNGRIRDAEQIETIGLPVFACGVGLTTIVGRAVVTDIAAPTSVEGLPVATGDLLVGCRGGVVVIPWNERDAVLERVRTLAESDVAVRASLDQPGSFESNWRELKN